MARFATGYDRVASVTVGGGQSFRPGYRVFVLGIGYRDAFNNTSGSAFGLACGATHVPTGVGYEEDPDYLGPGHRIKYGVGVQYTVGITGVEGVVAPAVIYAGGSSDWFIVPSLPTPSATYVSGGCSATLSASWRYRGYIDDVPGAFPYEEKENGNASVDASGTFIFQVQPWNKTVAVSFSYSNTWTDVQLGGPTNVYGASVSLSGVDTCSAGVSASLSGVSFGASAVSLAVGETTLEGDATGAVLTPYNPDPSNATVATSFISAQPDFAYVFGVANSDYETGDSMTVTTRHEDAGVLRSTSTTGTHATVTNANVNASLAFGGGLDTEVDTSNISNSNCVRVDEEWADSYGTFANTFSQFGSFPFLFPGTPNLYGLYASPDFLAGTLQVDDTHTFRLFETVDHFGVISEGGTVAMDGDAVFTTGDLTTGITDMERVYRWRPVGYRYYRFQMKSDLANSGVKLTLNFFKRNSLNAIVGCSVSWDFVNQHANEWETFTFDICLPDEIFDPATNFFNPGKKRVFLPVELQDFFNNDVGEGETDYNPFLTITRIIPAENMGTGPYGVHWLKDMQGYHEHGEGKIPALLVGPCQVEDGSSGTSGKEPAYYDFCSGLDTSFVMACGGELGFRLISNGMLTFNLYASSGSMDDCFNNLISYYDDSGYDTGLHFTKGTSIWMRTCKAESGFITRNPSYVELPLDEPHTIMGVARVARAYGTYGWGDFRTQSWGSTLVFFGDKVWNGELIANVHNFTRSLPDVTLELVEQEDNTVLETATSNRDGLVRLFHKYGVQRPYSNYPRGSTCSSRKQYTGDYQTGDVVYTDLGKKLNAYRVRCKSLRHQNGDKFSDEWYSTDLFPILDRYPHWRDFPCTTSGEGTWLLETPWGEFHVAHAVAGNIKYERSNFSTLPFAESTFVTNSGQDKHPRMVLTDAGLIILVFERNGSSADGVYETISDDHGLTWTTPTMAFSNGESPTIAVGHMTGEIIRAAIVGFNIKATIQYGGTPSAEFTFKDESGTDLEVEPVGFHLAQAYENAARWMMVCQIKDESEISYWLSGDEGHTWKRQTA